MRDLSAFADASFDLVWHAFSISFIPDVEPVFREVARVLRPAGLYRMECANPFSVAVDERNWDGKGYPLSLPYVDGEIEFADPDWEIWHADGTRQRVPGPREFRHTLSTLVNGLARHGFVITGLWEERGTDPNAAPGTWEHFKRIAPPWLTFWTRYRPDVLGG
jgi:SAM-dependent methyltransferase